MLLLCRRPEEEAELARALSDGDDSDADASASDNDSDSDEGEWQAGWLMHLPCRAAAGVKCAMSSYEMLKHEVPKVLASACLQAHSMQLVLVNCEGL